MKLILDSNVIVAAFATRGICSSIFEFCISNHAIYISEEIIDEISDTLESKIKLPKQVVDGIKTYLTEHCILSVPLKVESSACRDESDIHILGLAKSVGAELIISGDNDLLVLKEFEQSRIVSPRGFWEMIKK